MADSYEKDPFAEYDKYWDELDKKEEEVNRKQQKTYHFDDIEQEPTHQHDTNKQKAILSTIVGIGFVFTVIFLFVDSGGFILSPITLFIIIGIVISVINKNLKK